MRLMTRRPSRLLAAVMMLTAIGASCTELGPETLSMDNCDEIHNATIAARSIEAQAARNPIRFDDQIAGSLICVNGRVENIKWGRRPGERTWVYLNHSSTVQERIECALEREDAARIEENMMVAMSGSIPESSELDNVKRTTPLRDCKLLPRARW